MILTAIVRFVKNLKRTIKRIPRPRMPKVRIPKPKAPRAPQIDTDFLKRVASTAIHAPGFSLRGPGRWIKQIFHFAFKARAPEKDRRWYHVTPGKFALFAMIVIIPEFALQVAAFSSWLLPRYDKSPSILCIADYDTSYPSQLQEKIRNAKLNWKVIQEVHPAMTIKTSEKIIDSYKSTRKPTYVYLSVGQNEIRPFQSSQKIVVWDDSFKWKWRTILLGHFISSGDFGSVIASERFRELPGSRVVPQPGALPQAASQSKGEDKTKKEPGTQPANTMNQQSPQTSSQTIEAEKLQPELYDDPKLKDLISTQVSDQNSNFPGGSWKTNCLTMNFHPDGTVLFGDRKMKWSAVNSHLNMDDGQHQLDFLWRKDGDQLILVSDLSPIAILMRKSTSAEQLNPRVLFAIVRSWNNMTIGDMKVTEDNLKRAIQVCPNDPAVLALQARFLAQTGHADEAQRNVHSLQAHYNQQPDQNAAESLLFAMTGGSDADKVQTAIELLTKYPFSIRLWATIGEYALKAGNVQISRDCAKQAVNLLPDYLKRTKAFIFKSFNASRTPGEGFLKSAIEQKEKMKLFEQLQTMVRQKLTELVRKFPDKNPQIVFLLYPTTWAANVNMREIAKKENAAIVDFAKFEVRARTLRKSNPSPGQNFDIDQSNQQATTDLLVKTVFEDLTLRTQSPQKENQ